MKHAKEERRKRLAEKAVTAVTAIAAVVALTAGGTLAYFTASDEAHNVITSGGVGIELREWSDLGRTEPFADIEGVMPGESVTKVVEVANDGQQPVWVRVLVETGVTAAEGSEAELPADVVTVDWNTEAWVQGEGGWWYYGEPLQPGDVTESLFTAVAFDGPGMGDGYQGCELAVSVSAQAVQTANNGASALGADGWPEE